MLNIKPVLIAGLALVSIISQTVFAQGYAPYGYGNATPYNNPPPNKPAPYGYGKSAPYNSPAPYGYGNQNRYPNQYRNPYGNRPPYGYAPNRNSSGFNRFFGGNSGPFGGNNSPFGGNSGPFGGNNSPFGGNRNMGEQFWPGRGSVYDDVLPANGPWNRNWGRAPWNRNYDDLWGRDGGPSAWFDPSDPQEGIAMAWEDMMITPNALGTMPGGWEAPSISIPNPVDVGDELSNAARDMPDEMQNFSEGFTYGDGYNDGYDNPDRGSFGMGSNKKRDGISINTNRNRQ